MIRITMQNGKTIDIELDHSVAPITCENFEKLVKDGEVGEDEGARAEKELEAVTKRHVDQIDELLKHKEAELLEV